MISRDSISVPPQRRKHVNNKALHSHACPTTYSARSRECYCEIKLRHIQLLEFEVAHWIKFQIRFLYKTRISRERQNPCRFQENLITDASIRKFYSLGRIGRYEVLYISFLCALCFCFSTIVRIKTQIFLAWCQPLLISNRNGREMGGSRRGLSLISANPQMLSQ